MHAARARPLLIVHTGMMRGKSSAAFGVALRAWAAGIPIGVYQFVKSGRWRPGEEAAFRALGRAHAETGEGAPVAWHTLGDGGRWTRRAIGEHRDAAVEHRAAGADRDAEADHDAAAGGSAEASSSAEDGGARSESERAAGALAGWRLVQRDLAAERHGCYLLDELTYPMTWGWIDTAEVVRTLRERPGFQHVVVTGRDADPRLIEAADMVVEMTKVKHPIDLGQRGQRGIEW